MYRKNKPFLSILFLFNIFYMYAQHLDSLDLDSTKLDTLKSSNWKLKSLHSLNGTQSSFVNWNAGGRNNISLNASVRASATFNKEKWNWAGSAVNLCLLSPYGHSRLDSSLRVMVLCLFRYRRTIMIIGCIDR